MTAPPAAPVRRPPAPATEPSPWLAVAAIVLLAINLRTIIASLPPLLTQVRADLGLSATAAGLLTTLPFVCFGALAPAAPRLAERFSLERILVVCALITAAGAALRGAGGVVGLFAGSLIAGAGAAIPQAALPVFIRVRHFQHTGLLIGAFSMSFTLGGMLAAALAVPLRRAFGGAWEPALAVWAIPALVAAAVWLPAARRPGTFVHGERPPSLWGDRLAWSVVGFMCAQQTAFVAVLAWLPSILQHVGYSAGEAGTLQALNALVSVAPAFLVPLLAVRRRTQTPILAAIVALSTAGAAGLWLADGAAVLWVILFGLGQGGALGLAMILPALRGADARVTAALTAMMLCVGYLVASIGPWLLGAAHDLSGGWHLPLVLVVAMTLSELVPGIPATRDRTVTR